MSFFIVQLTGALTNGDTFMLHTLPHQDAVANIGHGCPDKVQKLMETSKSCYVHMLSLLATAALVKTLSSKRFVKAVNQAESIPDNLISNLSQTMSTCQELSLDVPGSLQALAGKYIKNNSGTSK